MARSKTTAAEFSEALSMVLVHSDEFEHEVHKAETFEETGLMTTDQGLVVELEDGSVFQVTVVRDERRSR